MYHSTSLLDLKAIRSGFVGFSCLRAKQSIQASLQADNHNPTPSIKVIELNLFTRTMLELELKQYACFVGNNN